VYDPYVDEAEAEELGVTKCDLKTLMSDSDAVSLHAPNLPKLRHMIGAEELACMKDGSAFINTARGALVDEQALIQELESGRIYACLDVTDPEPPEADSPLFTLPNVVLTHHNAGAMGLEARRIGAQCFEELKRYVEGKPPLYPIDPERFPITS
jgi:phosphoglycerate dehydrogenase-like enzyme